MKKVGTHVVIATSSNRRRYLALVSVPGGKQTRPLPGCGPNRESAIADALHLSQILYADKNVERNVLRAEGLRQKVSLVLVHDTLYLPQAA